MKIEHGGLKHYAILAERQKASEEEMTNTATADYEVYGGGTVYMLSPLNENAKTFLYDRLGDEAQFLGEAVAAEHHYIMDIVEDLRSNGFLVH